MMKNLPARQETQETSVRSLGQEVSLEEDMATHSSILAWRVPRTEQPGELVCPWSHKEWDTTGQLSMHTHVCLGLSRTFPTRILSSSRSNSAFKFLCILPVPPDLTGPCIWTLWQMTPRSHPEGWLGFICWWAWLPASLIGSLSQFLRSHSQGHSQSSSWLHGWTTKSLDLDTWHGNGAQ